MSAPRKNKSHLCFHGLVTASSPGVVATPVSGSRVAFVAFSLRITAFLVIIGQKCHVSFFLVRSAMFLFRLFHFCQEGGKCIGSSFLQKPLLEQIWRRRCSFATDVRKVPFPFFLLKNQRLEYYFRNGVQRSEKGQNYLLLRFIPQCADPSIFFVSSPFSSEHGSQGAHHNFSSSRLVGSFFPHKMVSRTPIITFLPQHLSRATMAL